MDNEFELNSFPTWIITYKSKSHNKNQTLYDQFSSESFYLKDSSTHVYVHSKFHWTYFCYDKLSGYILKNDKWELCYEGCETCSKPLSEIDYNEDNFEMFCTSCIEGY